VQEQLCSGTYMVAGDQWPILVYRDCKYDPENPWDGLFRSILLVSVNGFILTYCWDSYQCRQAYKHVFTSPSSVDKEPKATRSGNARIHGMSSVTPASIAYVATQVGHGLILYSITMLILVTRLGFPSLPLLSLRDRTPLRTLNGSTRVSLIYLKIRKRTWR
jgi:hypothetical protein